MITKKPQTYEQAFTEAYGNAPELGGQVVKPGTNAPKPLAVLFQGPWEREADGFAEHLRRLAAALALAGAPVHLRGSGPVVHYRDPPARVRDLLDSPGSSYSIEIRMMTLGPTSASTLFNILGSPAYATGEQLDVLNRVRVISVVLERDSVSREIAQALGCFGQVWVPCQRNADALARSGVPAGKIRVVRMPYFDDDPLLAITGETRRGGPPRFYHIGKWEPRKCQDRILLAFMRAWAPGKAQLTMKTTLLSNEIPDYPSAEGAIRAALADGRVRENGWTAENFVKWIEIIDRKLKDAEIVGLHRWGDIYVTLSRGEAVDMPAFDAKLAGNRLLYVPSGGPEEYADAADWIVPTSGSVACSTFYGWEPGSKYLDFEVDAAEAAFMLPQFRPWARARAVSKAFRAEAVGARMVECLRELVGPEGRVW